MKKSLVALAVLGAFSGVALAEGGGVTVYGIIDVGIVSQNNAPTGTASCTGTGITLVCTPNTGHVTAFQDAQILPSIYGLKGSEDLGGGLKAGFDLEGGFKSANGNYNSSNGGLFGRQAVLTLGGDWGTVGGGLQLDPAFVAAIATEPRGMTDSLSSLAFWILSTLGNNTVLTGGIFDTNSVSYTYAGSGLYLGLLYSFGGVAGSTTANSEYSIGGSYTNSGFTVSAGYVEDKANVPAQNYTGASSKDDFVGVGYAFGPYAVRVQYAEFKFNYSPGPVDSGTAASDVKDIGVGFDWKSGANTVNFSYYRFKDDGSSPPAGVDVGGKTTELALLDTYNLSKRTAVYGQVARLKADSLTASSGPGASTFANGGIYLPANVVPGDSSTIIGIGMQHEF